MRVLHVAILLLVTAWVSPHATAACTGSDTTVGNGPNTVWVSDWRCHGEFGSYKRTDTLVLLAGGRVTSVTMATSEDTEGHTTCTLSVTAAGPAAARGAPMPACLPGDPVLL